MQSINNCFNNYIKNPLLKFFYQSEPVVSDSDIDARVKKFFIEDELENSNEDKIVESNYFIHLTEHDVTYFEHFHHSITYCGMSLKSAFCFFIHAFYPDIFVYSGSTIVHKLNEKLNHS